MVPSRQENFSVVFGGDEGVGKTALINLFTQHLLCDPTVYIPTAYDYCFLKLVVNAIPYQLIIHDTAGRNENRQTFNELQLIQEAQLIVLVYSLDSLDSFNSIKSSLHSIRQVSDAAVILVGNKSDLRSQSVVKDAGFRLARAWSCQHVRMSTIDLTSLRDFQNAVAVAIGEMRGRDQGQTLCSTERRSVWLSCTHWIRKIFSKTSRRR